MRQPGETLKETIAVVFDFDDTLAPDTTTAFLEDRGVDTEKFWREDVDSLLADGWDPIPAYLYRMIELSRALPEPERITRESLRSFGARAGLQPGVTRIFGKLREAARESHPDVRLEFYVVSSGILPLVAGTRIAGQFNRIWACDFLCREQTGEILFPKNIISFTDKTRFLFMISKGFVAPEFDSRPFEVNRRVAREHLRIPFSQMIYVGDGYTDIPCFSLVRRHEGVAIGVYDPGRREKWRRAWGFIEDERVSNLVPARYTKDSALEQSLIMAVDSIAGRIANRRRA